MESRSLSRFLVLGLVDMVALPLYALGRTLQRSIEGTTPSAKQENSRFSGFWKRRHLWANRGLLIDGHHRLSEVEAAAHILVCAPSRSGKSASIIKPMLAEPPDGSLLICDPDGEMLAEFGQSLERKGFRLLVLDPSNRQGCRFNPLARLRLSDGSPDARAIRSLCLLLEPNRGGNDAPIWQQGSREILRILITGLVQSKDQSTVHIPSLIRLLGAARNPDVISAWLTEEVGDLRLLESFMALSDGAEANVYNGQLGNAISAVSEFASPEYEAFFADDDFGDFADIRTQKAAIFLCSAERDAAVTAKISAMFITSLLDRLMLPANSGSHLLQVYAVLEEFGTLSKYLHPNFPELISTCGRRRVALVMVTQSLKSQLRAAYGEDGATTVLTSTAHKLFLSGQSDPETLDLLSRSLGQTRQDPSLAGKTIPLMSPRQIADLKRYTAIYLRPFSQPVFLQLRPYFKVRRWRKLTALGAPDIPAFPDEEIQLVDLPLPMLAETEGDLS